VFELPLTNSIDLAPCDFYLLPKLKTALKGTHFQSVNELNSKTEDLLNRTQLMTNSTALNNGKQQCIYSGGEYVEGDSN
jgi:hypothetical protein